MALGENFKGTGAKKLHKSARQTGHFTPNMACAYFSSGSKSLCPGFVPISIHVRMPKYSHRVQQCPGITKQQKRYEAYVENRINVHILPKLGAAWKGVTLCSLGYYSPPSGHSYTPGSATQFVPCESCHGHRVLPYKGRRTSGVEAACCLLSRWNMHPSHLDRVLLSQDLTQSRKHACICTSGLQSRAQGGEGAVPFPCC